MALEGLPPDALELHIAMHIGVIPSCPFCAGGALLRSKINEVPAISKGPLYQGSIFCTDHNCMATVSYNARTREDAQQGAIARWSKRTPAVAVASPVLPAPG